MVKKIVSIILAMALLLMSREVFCGDESVLYSQARQFAKDGNYHFAFLNFDSLVKTYPESKLSEKSLFAVGEYYFSVSSYILAQETFAIFGKKYPKSAARIFALFYLLRISQIQNNDANIAALENEILQSRQSTFLFKDSKEYRYVSAFLKKYKAKYFIDRIEITINNEFFADVGF